MSRKAIVVPILCVILASLVSVIFINGEMQNTGVGYGLRYVSFQISDISTLISAPKGDLFFLSHSGASADLVAGKVFEDVCTDGSEVFYEKNDTYVDSIGCPRPEVFGAGKYLVFFGGWRVQPAVEFYEESGQTPVSIKLINQTYVECTSKEGQNINLINTAEFDGHHDMFIIEFFVDSYGRNVLICYGLDWQGTLAAAKYLVERIIPNANLYQRQFCVFRWVDTNNDYLPESNEVIEQEEKFVSIQAFLLWPTDPDTVEWFATACHSRGLHVTWYVTPQFNANLSSKLKGYMDLGDDIELSFGGVFFNTMTPEDRLQTVNRGFGAFKEQFGVYPSLAEAYYIDAFTLNYIASSFGFIKGVVGYVNHEEFIDGLKTAGAYYMPYYPSKFNALVPGTGGDEIPLVMLPFIQRDLSNCLISKDVRYNLCPQDGEVVARNWTTYFENLFSAYLNGWDQFGLAFYPIDLTFPILPKETIEMDLDFIHDQVQLNSCKNVLDKDFVQWFSTRYVDSPCYRWVYNDPAGGNFSSTWYFTYRNRTGGVIGGFSETRVFTVGTEEGCYFEPVYPYDNSFPNSSPNQ